MLAILHALGKFVADLFKSRSRLDTHLALQKDAPLKRLSVPKTSSAFD